jgi:hypothetical protein
MAANTPTNSYLDTKDVRKACKEDFAKIDKECAPENSDPKKKDNHLVLNKLLGKKTVDRLEALSKKTKDKFTGKQGSGNAWMSHCDGLWLKPGGGQDELKKLEEFKDLIGDASKDLNAAIKSQLEPLIEKVKQEMTDKALQMAAKKAAVYGGKTAARHGAALAGAAVGGVGAVVTEALALIWTIGDGLYTGYEVVTSGYDIYAAANEIMSMLDVAQRAQDELAKLAQDAQNMSPTDVMATGMGILSRLNPCTRARRCLLVPYRNTSTAKSLNGGGCCPGQTGHHVIPEEAAKSCSGYNHGGAPTICVEGVNNTNGTHGKAHDNLSKGVKKYKEGSWFGGTRDTISYEDMRDLGIDSVKDTFPESSCDKKCLKAQLDAYYNDKCKNDMPAAAGVSGGGRDNDETMGD